ncbi:MAG TPA: hypothetical protein VH396_06630 [Chitinophagaceae bacterium]
MEQLSENKILKQLEDGVSERERMKGQLHKVFKESFDAKPIYTRKSLFQKIKYMHLNPCQPVGKLLKANGISK